MTLDLRRLRYVHAIAQSGSLTRAADMLGVAQPALSHHLSELEKYFGVPLFHRTPRGMVPTDVGHILAGQAGSILRSVEDAEAAVRNGVATLAGSVSLGLLNTVALSLAVPLLQQCSERYPNIRLSIHEGTSQTLAKSMQKQELDLAVNLSEASEGSARLLATERLVLARRRDWDGVTDEIPLREALARPLILPPREHIIRKLVEWAAHQQDLRLDIRYEVAGGWTLKALVAAGLASTIIGRSAVTAEDLGNGLSIRPIVSPVLERRLVLVQSPMRATAPAVVAVSGLLQDLVVERSGDSTWTASPHA
ncbi:LysR family transcriptional regulator [Salipiger manganoxidans]|uniref:LysR family transcriptional regulator n=1 Tax=Salipiger marinus TaxID=555512 RepID=UPI001E5FD2CA|nr:LysR substrate-binding domain-containing protein [Salipiger manganoxidans]MCD1619367.1 LysR family transcriptional regulator [Salipiger manganoxidans]